MDDGRKAAAVRDTIYASKKDGFDMVDWVGGLKDGVKSRHRRRFGCDSLSMFEPAMTLLWFCMCGEYGRIVGYLRILIRVCYTW